MDHLGVQRLVAMLNATAIPAKLKRPPESDLLRQPSENDPRKQPVVDLDEDDDDDMPGRRNLTHWNQNEEMLLAETWIEHSQDINIGKDQQDDIYWNLIMHDFNSRNKSSSSYQKYDDGKMDQDARGSQSESVSSLVSQDYRRKCDAAERAYEVKRDKELAMMQCREPEFLMLDHSTLPPAKRAIIKKKQAEIMRKYPTD
nr:hypothetical protein [Tanacetum cinerariifolium]